MPVVTFLPAGVSVEADPGTSLLDAARQANVPIRNDCGGQGICTRCQVEVKRGEVAGRGSGGGLAEGRFLACRTLVAESDLEVYLPEETREVETEVTLRRTDPFPADYPPPGAMVETVELDLPAPNLDDNVSDSERLVRRLRKWRDAEYHIPLGVLKDLPVRLRDAQWRADVTVSVEPWGSRILRVGRPARKKPYMVAVDIGTTAIKAQLLAPEAGWVASCYNSQVMFGPDVISRIIHCQRDEEHGCPALKQLVVQDIERLIAALLDAQGVEREDVWALVVSGNTTMIHLFLGLYPVWIRREPYVGCAYLLAPVRPEDVGVNINPAGRVFCLPAVSSYVGADITAGVLATGLGDRKRPSALIDLGTNGEIAIGCEEFLVCCSASAGPAFEGGGSASGTRARPGAVESVWSEGTLRWRTVGDEPPVGICGTGYIDLLATLVRERIMDKTGRFVAGAPGVVQRDDEFLYVLAPAEQAAGGRDIILTQADVENLVRAKGAIYAAGSVLLESLGMDWGDLETIMLAGGFGDRLNKDNAVTIGLLPDVPRERIAFVGNTSLQGAVMVAQDAANYWKARDIAGKMTYFELSTHPDFMDRFVSACFLPHTDTEKFPSVSAAQE
ncbi:MAG: DUF4445 domain-containing protein [Candidatus Brocadiae bacterium]|nr:DUF4445 domain-containing protein [Candidatus Brocadiia bacterium]